MTVTVILESATDVHWMKDVVQFPLAVGEYLHAKKIILICRPNLKQKILASHISLLHIGEIDERNIAAIEKSDYSNIQYSPAWHIEACQKAAEISECLIIYPWFSDYYECSKAYKKKRADKPATVILKSDGLFKNRAASHSFSLNFVKDYFTYRYIDLVICENKKIYDALKNRAGILKKKLACIPNCPYPAYHDMRPVPYNEKLNRFLFIGRPEDPEKGVDILLNQWIYNAQQIPGWTLGIAGYASENLKNFWIKKLAESKLEDRVSWYGDTLPEELINLYRHTKIVVCPSRKESGPIILAEAALCGCAFIGTRVGEIPFFLTGLKGIADTEDALGTLMVQFATDGAMAEMQAFELRKRMGERNWKTQVEKAIGKQLTHVKRL